MQLQGETDDLAFCLSFSCYSSDDSLTASASTAAKVISELNQEYEFSDVDENDFEFSSPNTIQLHKSSVDEHELYSSSLSSSEADENECDRKQSGRLFCMWRPLVKKKSSSGSGSSSRRWRIWNSLRRSNSDGEDSVSKERRGGDGRLKTTMSLPASPSYHELFYVKKRAEQKGDKMKSFLPYKQDLLGLFVNMNKKLLF